MRRWTIIGTATGVELARGLEADTPEEALALLVEQLAAEEDAPVDVVRARFTAASHRIEAAS